MRPELPLRVWNCKDNLGCSKTLPGQFCWNGSDYAKILLCIPWSGLQASFIFRLGTTFPVSARAIRVQSSVIILLGEACVQELKEFS